MRAENSVKNATIAMVMNILNIVINLVTRKIFIDSLGTEYLGVNGLFSNILTMLSIAELGIGSAIIYSLYKPVAEKDVQKIKSLVYFYKKSYRIIAIIVSIIGICMIPFLDNIVGKTQIVESIVLLYVLNLADTVVSYLLTYKRSILYATQKTYVINIIHIGYIIVMNILQTIFLITTKNYITYLVIKIICRIVENIVITAVANKMYPYLKEKEIKKLDEQTTKGITKRVKGLIFHKIATFIVPGTDNIIMSKFFGVATVGLYSNYNMVIQAVANLLTQAFSSIVATVGNLLIEKNVEKEYTIYKNMLMINSWIYCFAAAAIMCLMEPFISLWVGEQYLLGKEVLIIITIYFYFQGMRQTSSTFKDAAGIFYEDRFVPIIESIANIIFSIIFVNMFGISGIFLGTIASNFILFLYSYPIFVFKKLFKRSYMEYIKLNSRYMIISVLILIVTGLVISYIKFENLFLELIVRGILVLIIPNLIQLIIYRKDKEFEYFKNVLKKLGKKFLRR